MTINTVPQPKITITQMIAAANTSMSKIANLSGYGVSTMSRITRHNIWPTSIDRQIVASNIANALTKSGFAVTAADILAAPAPILPENPNNLHEPKEDMMIIARRNMTQAARKHFNFASDPFTGAIKNAGELFETRDVAYARTAMHSAAQTGGFIAIVGESGCGKTTLIEDLEDRITREAAPITVIRPFMCGVEKSDKVGKTIKSTHLAEAILNKLQPGQPVAMSSEARFRQLKNALEASFNAGLKHVLIIEESHGVNKNTLRHLKRFMELKTGYSSLLSIILCGQPELKYDLHESNTDLREVIQRIEVIDLV
ncbi:MAG: AAA family ATPase, partial [Alphaproteobacteria bacterium]|nr:AAA family ATPase [Alphaproteobacteria bacterium]